jgi:hypothetical protein
VELGWCGVLLWTYGGGNLVCGECSEIEESRVCSGGWKYAGGKPTMGGQCFMLRSQLRIPGRTRGQEDSMTAGPHFWWSDMRKSFEVCNRRVHERTTHSCQWVACMFLWREVRIYCQLPSTAIMGDNVKVGNPTPKLEMLLSDTVKLRIESLRQSSRILILASSEFCNSRW